MYSTKGALSPQKRFQAGNTCRAGGGLTRVAALLPGSLPGVVGTPTATLDSATQRKHSPSALAPRPPASHPQRRSPCRGTRVAPAPGARPRVAAAVPMLPPGEVWQPPSHLSAGKLSRFRFLVPMYTKELPYLVPERPCPCWRA